jgi:hypothetical protein
MVGTGHPASILSLHTGTTNQNILDSFVKHMAHMEHAGNVWRGDYYGIWFSAIRFGAKQFMLHPIGIPFIFNL